MERFEMKGAARDGCFVVCLPWDTVVGSWHAEPQQFLPQSQERKSCVPIQSVDHPATRPCAQALAIRRVLMYNHVSEGFQHVKAFAPVFRSFACWLPWEVRSCCS